MAASPYRLSCSLNGHTLDVRSVAVTSSGKIVSGSRDKTAKIWIPNVEGRGFRESVTLSNHNNFVSCVCAFPPNKTFPNGLIITGSNDHAIRLFNEATETPVHVLANHTNTVCKVVLGEEEDTILSASWDQTAKLWNLRTCKVQITFSGHKGAVWSVLQLSNCTVVTASADKEVKIWNPNGCCKMTLTGHSDCVRDLAPAGAYEFLSCSNDATVRHWDSETGECLSVYYGHHHFIYCISPLASGFVTSSEDKTVKVWNNGEVLETIPIPASTVWCVASLPNGDIVTGSSDGIIRVFSSDVSRQASEEEKKCYEEQLAIKLFENYEQIGNIKISDLPEKEALNEPGKKDGQTKLIREGMSVIAYAWSALEGKWNKIGVVVGSPDDAKANESEKPVHNGKEYDYVFSVDVEEGKPPLKLPYNRNEDPWHAAQNFIQENHLSQHFLEEVANFIIRNSQQQTNPISPSVSEFADPFTGSARYIPQSSNIGSDNAGNTFTSKTNVYSDSREDPNKVIYFPQRDFLKFDQANLNLILEKLLEFNKRSGDGNQLVSDSEIEDLMKVCEAGASCRPEDISTLSRLFEWPEEIIFPVLDVMRLAIRNSDINSYLCNDELIPGLMKFLMPGSSVPPNNMLALRVLSNMLASEAGENLAAKNKIKLLNILRDISGPYIKPVQVAMATLLLNVAVIIRKSETPEGRTEALAVTQQILPILTDQEALFRALVALGTLLVDFIDGKSYSSIFKPLLVKYQSDSNLGKKIQDCSQQILLIL